MGCNRRIRVVLFIQELSGVDQVGLKHKKIWDDYYFFLTLGTIAQNYSDLGYHEKEDMCCREHDNCKNYLSAGECRQGICNKSPYTRQ